jgi:hypothetical protein
LHQQRRHRSGRAGYAHMAVHQQVCLVLPASSVRERMPEGQDGFDVLGRWRDQALSRLDDIVEVQRCAVVRVICPPRPGGR